jgi:predicted nucleic acid-binding protein
LKIYLDSSFIVSLYSIDSYSPPALELMGESDGQHLITVFAELEVMNAFELRHFRKEITADETQRSRSNFESDIRDGVFQLLPLPDGAFERARALARQYTRRLGTRAADLLHVAAALELDAGVLYTFDQQQRKLARTAGLKTN